MNSGLHARWVIVADTRDDMSPFVVHLTRDDSDDLSDGSAAHTNVRSILDERRIGAFKPHGLYGRRVATNHKEHKSLFEVASFTETPLNQIDRMLDVWGRKVGLKPYGFVFTRE